MKKEKIFAACAAVVFVLCFAVVGVGAEKQPILNKVADVSIGSYGIHWQPRVENAGITLTIDCAGGRLFHKAFEAGVAPYFSLSDLEGMIAEGMYTYELVVSSLRQKKKREPANAMPAEAKGDRNVYGESLIQSGYFTVRGGAIVTPGIRESGLARPLDEVVSDDLIVDGSLCVGNDCYSGLAFGFDTIVLMENNLRIFFDDTSNTSSFPNNDWRIICNDTTDGGGAYFAVQDATNVKTPFTIEANAKTNSLYVDDDGQVGIGTSGPVFELHIKEGDSPTVRLHQSTAYGWPEQIWDVGGNETSFFVRDGSHAARLPFRIEPETPSNTLCLKSDGKVGIGTWSPSYFVHAETTSENCAFVAERTDGATIYMNATDAWGNFGTVSGNDLRLMTNGTAKVMIETDGDVGIGGGATVNPPYKLTVYNDAGTAYGYSNGGSWATGSSREFKEKIKDLDGAEAMAAFDKLNPIRFHYKGVEEDEHLGFIAEDVPEIVATRNRDAIAAMDIVTLLTKVVQEQQKAVRQQQKTINELKERIAELEKK